MEDLTNKYKEIVQVHRHGHQNGQQSGHTYIVVLFAVALAAAGAIRSD